jgi:hypothetical protein
VQDCMLALQPQDLTLIPNDFPPAQDHFAINFGEFNIRPPVAFV